MFEERHSAKRTRLLLLAHQAGAGANSRSLASGPCRPLVRSHERTLDLCERRAPLATRPPVPRCSLAASSRLAISRLELLQPAGFTLPSHSRRPATGGRRRLSLGRPAGQRRTGADSARRKRAKLAAMLIRFGQLPKSLWRALSLLEGRFIVCIYMKCSWCVCLAVCPAVCLSVCQCYALAGGPRAYRYRSS